MRFIRSCLIAIAALSASPSSAQTAAQEYFAELKSMYDRMGIRLEVGAEEVEGEFLVLREVSFSVTGKGVSISGAGDEMRIAPTDETGYSLALVWPARMTFSSSVQNPGVEPVAINGVMELPGNETLIGGQPGNRTYAFSAERMRLEYAPVEMPPDGSMAIAFTFTSVAGTGSSSEAEGGSYSYSVTASDLAIAFAISAPDGGMSLASTYRGVKFDAKGPLIGMVDPAFIFDAGAATDARMDLLSSEGRIEIMENGVRTVISTTTGPGRLTALFGDGQLDYSLESETSVFEVTGDALPVPMARVEARSLGMRFAMPVVPRDTPGLMALDLRLEDVALSENIWGMADPAGVIPRLPATVILRARSAVTPLVNIMDPIAMENAPPEAAMMPFRFESVSVKEVVVRIAGVELNATGDVEIRNDGPVPQPVGGFDVTIDGVIALSAKLAQVGIIPPDQAAASEMILGMYARPGDRQDSFSTRIELAADGSITANGVPLQ